MAVTKTSLRVSATGVLNAGTDAETGKMLTKNVSLTGLRGNPDNEGIVDVFKAAAPCLAYPVASMRLTEVSTLEESA